jgi:hypothetical protein
VGAQEGAPGFVSIRGRYCVRAKDLADCGGGEAVSGPVELACRPRPAPQTAPAGADTDEADTVDTLGRRRSAALTESCFS